MHAITRGLDHCIAAVDGMDSAIFSCVLLLLLLLILEKGRNRFTTNRMAATAVAVVLEALDKGVTHLKVDTSWSLDFLSMDDKDDSELVDENVDLNCGVILRLLLRPSLVGR